MNNLAQSIIIQAERGQDVFSLGRQFADQKNDIVIEVFEHKKKDGVKIGIFVDDIRDLIDVTKTARGNCRTIAIIADAQKMTLGAQNAILKLLEEPRQGLHIILVTANPKSLASTIASRCQIIKPKTSSDINIPDDKKAKAVFMASGNKSELAKLVKDEKYFNQQVELFEVAKQFVSSKKYQRIRLILKFKDSRDDALELIRASLIVSYFLLKTRPSAEIHKYTKKLLKADSAIRKNGNVRLWLLKTVV